MSPLSGKYSAVSWALVALAGLVAVVGCGLPEPVTNPTTQAAGPGPADTLQGKPPVGSSVDPTSSLLTHRNATIRTGFDTYVVHDISFDTAEGFGSSEALMGFYNNTVWEFKLKFIEQIDVIGTVSASEAQSAPSNYFVREEEQLRRTFRTRLRKTDGETIEFIVRINAIRGPVETGGSLNLSRDELETLRRIEFF
jgi:hypothetical protein